MSESTTDETAGAAPRLSSLDPLSQRIVDLLRDRGLRPGDPVPTELELIEALAVSRNSVREALRPLRALGIVEVRHGHGTVVGEPSLHVLSPSLIFRAVTARGGILDGLRDLVEVRELIEVGIVERMAGHVEEAALDRLDELCEELTRSGLAPESDREFHRTLYSQVDNPLIGQLVDVFWDAYEAARSNVAPPEEGATERTVRRHRAIVTALRSGDGDAARAAMRDHFAEIKRRLDDGRSTAPAE